MKYPAAVLLAVSSFSLGAAERVDVVPARFLGEWSADITSCGSDVDDSVLVIKPRHIAFWESSGPIKAVVANGSREIMLIAEVSGEGFIWLSNSHFTLSADGSALTAIDRTDTNSFDFDAPPDKRKKPSVSDRPIIHRHA